MVLRLDEAPNRGDDAKSRIGTGTAKEGRYRQRLTIEIATNDGVGPRSRHRQIDVNERREVVSGTEKIGRREDGIRPEIVLEHQIALTDEGAQHFRIEQYDCWRRCRTRRTRERIR